MAFATHLNMEKICRTCLSEETNMRSIFSADEKEGVTLALYEMLMSCVSLQIMEKDGLPEQVCLQCTRDIIRSFSFKQLCQRSDSTLRQILIQPKEEKEEEEVLDDITEPYMELKPYPNGPIEIEISKISDQNSYEYLEPKIQLIDDTQGIDPLDGEVADVEVKSEICKEETKVKIYEEQITYPCAECTQCFNSAADLKVHMQTHPKETTKHICKVCHRDFARACTLSRHMKVHDGNGPNRYLCSECGKCFSRSDTLTVHLRVHTGEKPYLCKICGKSFPESGTLLEHTRAHANKKTFVCSVCSKAFSRLAGLAAHKKTHSGIKTHECTICGKRLCGPGSLAIHKKIHTGVKDHICTYCGKGFTTRCNMKSHERTHTGEKPYVCNICDKRFPNLSGLTVHNRSHSNESPQLNEDNKSDTDEKPITSESIS